MQVASKRELLAEGIKLDVLSATIGELLRLIVGSETHIIVDIIEMSVQNT